MRILRIRRTPSWPKGPHSRIDLPVGSWGATPATEPQFASATTIRARCTKRHGDLDRRIHPASATRSWSLSPNDFAVGPGITAVLPTSNHLTTQTLTGERFRSLHQSSTRTIKAMTKPRRTKIEPTIVAYPRFITASGRVGD